MCGLFGYFSPSPAANPGALDVRLRAVQHALHHRGPDDRGLETLAVAGGILALGHTRLSIIDLSPGGHQPMHSQDGRYTIVFNGEIYNYRELRQDLKSSGHVFRTDSDTEVLLASWGQWGIEGLRRLTGMFAFAVFDRSEQMLTLVRDAFGIKPLFYRYEEKGLSFASEIPALLELLTQKPGLNLQRAYDYLVFGRYDDDAQTFYEGVYHLLPGHWLRLDLRTDTLTKPQRWWWPSIEERRDLSFEVAAEQLREMFLDNIRLHLRSDVPLGAALSGGVDSSAVVCAMRHLEPDMPIHTFTYVARGSSVDEERWADIVNEQVCAIPHKVVVSPNELADDLYDMIGAQGEPFGSTSIYAQYRVFKAARDAGITVTLDGQGADELLAGYNGYPSSYVHSLLDKHRYREVPRFLGNWARWPGRSYLQAVLVLAQPMVPKHLRRLAYQLIGRTPTPTWIDIRYLSDQGVMLGPPAPLLSDDDTRGRRLAGTLRAALAGQGLASLLRHGDRDSMRWTIESRVPFLTTGLAEFLLSLPESFLLSPQGETKRIFRAAMRGIVPDVILDRRDKIGFQTPEHAWLSNQGEQIQGWLSSADELPFLDGTACRREVSQLIDGSKGFSPQAWRLLNFSLWVQMQR